MARDPAPILINQRKFAFALETTTGTKATLAVGNAVTPCFNPDIVPDIEEVPRPHSETAGKKPSRHGAAAATATWATELYGSNVSGTRPDWVKALRGCGYDDSGTAGIFKPITGSNYTLSGGLFRPGRSTYIIGAMGTAKLTLTAGRPALFEWTFRGAWDTPDATALSTITYDSVTPPHVGAINFALGTGDRITVPQVEIDLGNTVYLRPDIEAVDSSGNYTGIRAAWITDRDPKLMIKPEMLSLAARDWFSVHRNYTLLAFTCTLGTGFNKCTISAPKLQLEKAPATEDDNKLARDALSFACRENAGDDELVFDFVT